MALRTFAKHRISARQATIGFLGATTPTVWSAFTEAFEKQLRADGWVNGINLAIEYEWAEGNSAQYAAIAKRFVRREVDVIVTSGTAPALAAKAATQTIPIVFASAGDPQNTGLVPKGSKTSNVTGFSNGQDALAPERVDLLLKTVPTIKKLAVLYNPGVKNAVLDADKVEDKISADYAHVETIPCPVKAPGEIASKIRSLRGKADAVYVCTDPFVTTHLITVNIAAAAAGLPTIHAFREYAELGGLMSYGPTFRTMFARAAGLVNRILLGTEPHEIPIETDQSLELVINRSTAKALGLKIPKTLAGRKDVRMIG